MGQRDQVPLAREGRLYLDVCAAAPPMVMPLLMGPVCLLSRAGLKSQSAHAGDMFDVCMWQACATTVVSPSEEDSFERHAEVGTDVDQSCGNSKTCLYVFTASRICCQWTRQFFVTCCHPVANFHITGHVPNISKLW